MSDIMEEREIHLRDYYKVIVKRRYTVATVFAVVFLVSLIVTFSTTPLYMATTKILIEKSEPNNLATMNFYYVPYDPDFYETQYQLIKSTPVAEKVVDMLSLDKSYGTYFDRDKGGFKPLAVLADWVKETSSAVFGGKGGDKTQSAGDNNGNEGHMSRHEMLAREISESLIITPLKNTKLVEVGYMSTNPELAALVVNSIAKAYMENILEMKMSFSKYTMQWLEEKAEEERTKLERSEQALQAYMKEKDIVTLENRIAMLPERLSEVATKVAEAETKRKEKETLYEQVKNVARNPGKAETIPVIASDPTIQALRVQILKAEQNILDMSRKYGKKHPAMITATGDLKILRDKKEQEIRRVVESIRNEYELAKANEENLRKMVSETKAATLNLNEKFIQYGVLKRESETNKQLFDAIIKRIKEQGITQDIRTIDVSVVEKAEVPKSPAKPKKLLNILLGLIVGLMGGVGLAFFVEYLDNTVKFPEDAESKLGSPVLGIVNLLNAKGKSIEEIVLKEPQSVFAEGYKVIRTSILLSSSDKPLKNILVTSISPGEGKTATAVNLALTVAQSEHSVLLVDGDLRRPRVHKIFGLDNSKGLSTYLAGASDIHIVPAASRSGIQVMPSGPVPPNPSELLSSRRMQKLLSILADKFDIVIWDSPPLMTVTDSLVLSKILDGTIIVAKAGKTTFENVRKGMKSLSDIESHFLGIIINALEVKKSDYYYNRYYQSYYYGKEKE
jgi:succinoglycan biosynthesis transport protein ExoP